MRIKIIKSDWIKDSGYRLDNNPYLSGAIEARETLEHAELIKTELVNLSLGGKKGLINPGRIKRIWAESNKHGVNFLSSTDILKNDLSYIKAISYKSVLDNPKLLIQYGDILITRAGTIGRMAFTREDMDGFACSEDVLRIKADTDKISCGYLYAYLRTKFGVPLILSSTYGAIIQHIEPHHLVSLPVPRLAIEKEKAINEMVYEASKKRTLAKRLIHDAELKVERIIGDISDDYEKGVRLNVVSFSELKSSKRFDVPYFSYSAQSAINRIKKNPYKELSEVATVFKPAMFKRIMSSQENGGIPFYTGSELFLTELNPKYYVSEKTQNIQQCILEKNWILLQAFGQRGGLIGRAMLTTKKLENSAATDLQIQIKLNHELDAGFVLAFLGSKPGYATVIRNPVGGSIPHINAKDIEKLVIPWPEERTRRAIGEEIITAWELRYAAQELEEAAIKMVEDAIEAAAPKH